MRGSGLMAGGRIDLGGLDVGEVLWLVRERRVWTWEALCLLFVFHVADKVITDSVFWGKMGGVLDLYRLADKWIDR